MLQAPQQEAVGSSRNQDCILTQLQFYLPPLKSPSLPSPRPSNRQSAHIPVRPFAIGYASSSQGISAVQLFALREQGWPESHYTW